MRSKFSPPIPFDAQIRSSGDEDDCEDTRSTAIFTKASETPALLTEWLGQ
jgi:hypothetical protein